ncbi:hypothetical protein [Novosphingobium sp. JCM 18896]|uniref:hypothetical protein n=1 Tax=Novosphingobium sp. JCM 18896 TaxID=2989731 RepID=UPI0022229F18|nr:hypothetical protein [Novosphingobium sp. JCM 18896]
MLSLLLELSGAAAFGLAAESLLRRCLRVLPALSSALDALGSAVVDWALGSAVLAAGSLGVAAEPAAWANAGTAVRLRAAIEAIMIFRIGGSPSEAPSS